MPRQFPTFLFAAGVNLGQALQLAVEDIEGWADGPTTTLSTVAIPRRAGRLVTRAEQDQGRQLTITASLLADTRSERSTYQDRVKALLGSGPITVQRTDELTRVATGYVQGPVTITEVKARRTSAKARIRFTLFCGDPLLQELAPLPYGFSTAFTEMPLGTAPVAPLIRLFGSATNPVLTYATAAGEPIAAIQFTVALGANDYLEIDTRTYRIEKVAAGSRSSAYDTYAGVTDNLPVLDPEDGDIASGTYPMLKVSAGAGVALYARRYR